MKKNILQMLFPKLHQISFFLLFFTFSIQQTTAQTITMPNVIGNNMVLQQNTQVPIWGWAAEGTSVTITGSWGQTVTTTAATTGKWMTKIQTPVAVAGQAPVYTLTIAGPVNTITFSNILVGEVWLCSGQSNMWFPMNYIDATYPGVVDYTSEIATASYPNIRFFAVPKANAAAPASNCNAAWTSCTPTTVSSFSSAAYYFGRELYNNAALNVPIGLIHSAFSNSAIQAWMKNEVLQNDAELKVKYIDPIFGATETKPSLLYNAMIAPIIPYAIKGAIWFQGDSNVSDGDIYAKANIAMLNDWRSDWGIDFSFYACQLYPRLYTGQKDLGSQKATFREVQGNITTSPKTGIIACSDLILNDAELFTPHPRDKKSIGTRFSLWALAKDYGQNVQYLGPKFDSYIVEGNKIRITFKSESLGTGLITKDGFNPSCFKLSASNKTFYPALAVIEGNTIVVSSTNVTIPVSVRYAFTEGARTNLMNNEGLPAYAFKTDIWPYVTYVDMPEIGTSVENTKPEVQAKLFPCVFNNYLDVSGVSKGIQSIDVFDMMGRKVKSQTGDNTSNATLDVSILSNGVYMLRVIQSDLTTIDFKAIKQ